MRVAVSTVAFPGAELLDLPRLAREAGAEGIALGVAPGGPMAPDAPAAEVSGFLARCRDEGVVVSAVYGYAGRRLLLGGDAARADCDLAKTCIDLAAALGASVCRVFAGTQPGSDTVINRFADACRPLASHAASLSVRLGFPTHHDLASDMRSCRRLIEGVGRDGAGIIFTGANLELDGVAPLGALDGLDGIVLQAELKDWRRDNGAAHPVPIGDGEATVWPLVAALAARDAGGWITVHYLRQHHPELPALDPAVAARVRTIVSGVMKQRVTTVAALAAHVGQELGVGDWLTITQERIDAFADATGDHQWIHVDPERCRAAGNGGTIAHGYLLLSLITLLRSSLRGIEIDLDVRMGVNYGSDRVRFITPVCCGSRIRLRVTLLALHEVARDEWQAKYRHLIEIEGEARPALVAETLNRIYLHPS
jgi:acyl dehydratase/sugar phosphate isomerase/epimerase